MINWEKYRNRDGYLELTEAVQEHPMYKEMGSILRELTLRFLKGVEESQPIVSRQVAALALQTAAECAVSRAHLELMSGREEEGG